MVNTQPLGFLPPQQGWRRQPHRHVEALAANKNRVTLSIIIMGIVARTWRLRAIHRPRITRHGGVFSRDSYPIVMRYISFLRKHGVTRFVQALAKPFPATTVPMAAHVSTVNIHSDPRLATPRTTHPAPGSWVCRVYRKASVCS